ncbi:uncharacterized protein LOC132613085 [Lycium barbarum]|uniref:uncharacterized protein LOC132613085 n=1 Tax=Lycium barbarum TaxID=112863 RepID=UPI00293ED6A6|nr:uncharacterized protein LOC132613085 [Lycium barbarum]
MVGGVGLLLGGLRHLRVRPWRTYLLRELVDRVKLTQEKFLAAQIRQKMYADRKVRDLEFEVDEQASPMGVMRFGKRGKLNPGYLSPFEIIRRVGDVAYELALPPGQSGVHPVFHLSVLEKYHSDGTYIVYWDSVLLDENLTYEEEPITILDRQVWMLRSK